MGFHPDCYYGDHTYHGGGQCVRCGLQLRCDYCGQFLSERSLEAHFSPDNDKSCRVLSAMDLEEEAA